MLKPDWHRFVEPATQRRILSGMLRYISSADYAPRAESLESFRDRLLSGGTGPLHGCDVRFLKGWTVVFRELAATQGSVEVSDSAALWDGRWVVDGAAFAGLTIRALGEDGWRQVENRSDPALPHRMALSLPSLWEGETLVACDALGVGPGQTTRLSPKGIRQPYFPSFLLSH